MHDLFVCICTESLKQTIIAILTYYYMFVGYVCYVMRLYDSYGLDASYAYAIIFGRALKLQNLEKLLVHVASFKVDDHI